MTSKPTLTTTDHARDAVGMTYVYPVISRRAGGVSVGINLNPNNACNWRCVYCQVPNLVRGTAPVIDLALLEHELTDFLQQLLHGDFMATRVPEGARRLNDIAISGNGEPTSAREFADIVALIGQVMARFDLVGKIKLVLISNGSLLDKAYVQAGVRRMADLNGEVWFKLDSATRDGLQRINHSEISPARQFEYFKIAASLCPTWLQTCVFAFDGAAPSTVEQQAYLAMLAQVQAEQLPLQGVLLYGLARPSMQPEAAQLSALPAIWLETFAEQIRALGITVKVSV
ncbi:radical SAM protein [Sulfuriferula sp.]|uniref:radical SAM protein n=1 Tax=Sulfuriferula sp. TaxID=2025307 RepID=UPI002730AAB2|nr:radical SAM protein [Sulfuriferula sp.]MDP2027707.1 radical SAM protein [Sulfuriferula sp.]